MSPVGKWLTTKLLYKLTAGWFNCESIAALGPLKHTDKVISFPNRGGKGNIIIEASHIYHTADSSDVLVLTTEKRATAMSLINAVA